jgi:hypothetical protein
MNIGRPHSKSPPPCDRPPAFQKPAAASHAGGSGIVLYRVEGEEMIASFPSEVQGLTFRRGLAIAAHAFSGGGETFLSGLNLRVDFLSLQSLPAFCVHLDVLVRLWAHSPFLSPSDAFHIGSRSSPSLLPNCLALDTSTIPPFARTTGIPSWTLRYAERTLPYCRPRSMQPRRFGTPSPRMIGGMLLPAIVQAAKRWTLVRKETQTSSISHHDRWNRPSG